MVGRLSNPMVTTVAPTMPVEAASNAPTIMTENPRPPRSRPNNNPMVPSNCSANFERSNITPMKMNNGTATNTSFNMTPIKREASPPNSARSNTENIWPTSANASAVPASVNATG